MLRWRIFLWFGIPSTSLRLTLRGRLSGQLTNRTKIVTTHDLADNIKFLFLRSHNVQYVMVGFVHARRSYKGKVSDTVIDIVINDPFYARDTMVFHG